MIQLMDSSDRKWLMGYDERTRIYGHCDLADHIGTRGKVDGIYS